MSTVHSLSLALCFAVALVRGQPDVTCLLDCPLPMTVCVIDAITGEESCEGVEFTTSTTTPAPIMTPTDPMSTDTETEPDTTDMPMSTDESFDSSSGSSDSDSLEFSSTDSASGDSGDSSDSDSADSDDFSSTMMVECVTRGLCPEGQECVINDMGEEECKEAQNAYSANESSTGEMDATSTHDVVVSVVGAVGLLGLMAVAIALCCYCGRCASKEGAGSIDLGLTMAEIECEDSAGKGRTTNKETAKYGMVTQIEMDGEEELMSDHDEDLIGDHSEMIQLAMPARQTAGNITGHAMEEEL